MVVQLLVLSLLAFSILYVTPGSIELTLLGPTAPSPEALQAIRDKYGLDDSFVVQYLNWLGSAVHMDFGRSITTGQSVSQVLSERAPTTFFLAAMALTIVAICAIPLGLVAGIRAGRLTDRVISTFSAVAVSAPVFATGVVLLYVFGVALAWFPVYGSGEGVLDRAWHLALPSLTLALSVMAVVIRQTRASTMKVARADYVTFAQARGIANRRIWSRYVLRNGSLPVATSIGLVLAYLLTGPIIVERVFSLSGLGDLLVTSITTKDLPVVQALTLLVGLMVLLANLLADISHMVLDPRVRKAMLG